MNNQTFVILPVADLSEEFLADFDQTSLSTIRKSVDGTLAILAWCGPKPQALVDYEATHGSVAGYSYDQVLSVIETPTWSKLERLL